MNSGNPSLEVILKSFDNPDEITPFEKGKFEKVTLGGMTIGRATYQPGWKCQLMSVLKSVKTFAQSNMLAWSFPELRPRHWLAVKFLN